MRIRLQDQIDKLVAEEKEMSGRGGGVELGDQDGEVIEGGAVEGGAVEGSQIDSDPLGADKAHRSTLIPWVQTWL